MHRNPECAGTEHREAKQPKARCKGEGDDFNVSVERWGNRPKTPPHHLGKGGRPHLAKPRCEHKSLYGKANAVAEIDRAHPPTGLERFPAIAGKRHSAD